MARQTRDPRKKPTGGLPSKDELLKFVAGATGKVGRREVARAFNVRGSDRVHLKRMLAELAAEGRLSGNRKALRRKGTLPPVAVLEIVARDADGDLIAEPLTWPKEEGARPRARLTFLDRQHSMSPSDLGAGDRVLARIARVEDEEDAEAPYTAEPIRKLPREKRRLLGIFRRNARGGGRIQPVDRKELREWPVAAGSEAGAREGDLVRFDILTRGRLAVPEARVLESLGNPDDQRQISLIAVHAHGLPDTFPDAVLQEAQMLRPAPWEGRADLRPTPFVTIDPADARDHDDAVHAEPDPDPANAGGFIVTVAIADVAAYVRPASRLDREAQLRGNSVYFPDRVVPMLPERLSNDLCSLREGEDRPCLAVRMVFDRRGTKKKHTFLRAMMRSAAKLSYQEAQAAFDGQPSGKCAPLMEKALLPLWRAYRALAEARDRRAPLDLDLPERRILLDAAGRVERVVMPERLAAHRLIEEFMIQANVAAAETLEGKRAPVVYRVHEPPAKEKLAALRDFLATLNLKLPTAAALKPVHFNRILAAAKRTPIAELVNEVVLRTQAQAEYATENAGHFGLNLGRYAHFTSPIRRYADLLVHRSLIAALRLGAGGLEPDEADRLADLARAISDAERRAMAAERETADRLIAAYLADRVGAEFAARVSGVTRSGLFVRLADTGADGFVPASSIAGDFYVHVEESHALVGRRTGRSFQLGDSVQVRLVEALPSAGALRFEMLSEGRTGLVAHPKAWRSRTGTRRR
ncbi:MAG TPA: ribonuclease R [Hyphomicrobiaceae bacterium]|nr:ribonuclease R [Hyphomicrobiaceae bacterium]